MTDPFKMPQGLDDLSDQLAYAVGTLVANTANCESLFFGFLSCVITDERAAQLTWLNIKSTSARVAFTVSLCQASNLPKNLVSDIRTHAGHFRGILGVRNFYCHSYYAIEVPSGGLSHLENYSMTGDEHGLAVSKKPVTPMMLNEIVNTCRQAIKLTKDMWPTILDARSASGSGFPELSEEQLAYLKDRGVRPAIETI